MGYPVSPSWQTVLISLFVISGGWIDIGSRIDLSTSDKCFHSFPTAGRDQVGVMDMLRFDEFTIGYAWRSDFGSSRASEEQFKTLRAYSPVRAVAFAWMRGKVYSEKGQG